jgi:glycosyltransferase involved in cell wall biosynthesis
VLVGTGIDLGNADLGKLIDDLGLRDRVKLLGPRDDVPALMAALDWHVLSSAYGEAFPNVVAESMACGVPNVVTDVGDAAAIVGDCGLVARPGDVDSLASAVERALSLSDSERDALGVRCRERISGSFALSKMVSAYERVWRLDTRHL